MGLPPDLSAVTITAATVSKEGRHLGEWYFIGKNGAGELTFEYEIFGVPTYDSLLELSGESAEEPILEMALDFAGIYLSEWSVKSLKFIDHAELELGNFGNRKARFGQLVALCRFFSDINGAFHKVAKKTLLAELREFLRRLTNVQIDVHDQS